MGVLVVLNKIESLMLQGVSFSIRDLNRIESPLLYRVSICFFDLLGLCNVVNVNGFLIWKRKVSNYMDKMMRLLLNEMHVFVKD